MRLRLPRNKKCICMWPDDRQMHKLYVRGRKAAISRAIIDIVAEVKRKMFKDTFIHHISFTLRSSYKSQICMRHECCTLLCTWVCHSIRQYGGLVKDANQWKYSPQDGAALEITVQQIYLLSGLWTDEPSQMEIFTLLFGSLCKSKRSHWWLVQIGAQSTFLWQIYGRYSESADQNTRPNAIAAPKRITHYTKWILKCLILIWMCWILHEM
jgi:hypothetical protein